MSEVPPPKFSDANSPWLLHALALFGRGLIYALAFWAVYRVMLLVYPAGASSTESDEKLRQRQTTQMNSYDEQVQKANQMFDESEKQQARMRALVSKQEEQAKRFDAILDQWERQARLHK